MTADTNIDDCDETLSPPTGLMRDIFRSVDSLTPVPFTGSRIHLLTKLGFPIPITTVLKLNTDGPKPSGLWLSALYKMEQWRGLDVSSMADMHLSSGRLNFKTMGRLEISNSWLDVSLAGQVCRWCHPVKLQVNMDYWLPSRTLSLSIDPMFKNYTFQFLQSVSDRLSLGINLAFKGDTACSFDESRWGLNLVAKYAGPDFIVSGKVDTTSWATKVVFYTHCYDWLQTGTTFELDPSRSMVTTRWAFRILSDTSVFRAAIDSNGIVSSLWEKRFGERMAVSLSMFHAKLNNCGLGIGLSFG